MDTDRRHPRGARPAGRAAAACAALVLLAPAMARSQTASQAQAAAAPSPFGEALLAGTMNTPGLLARVELRWRRSTASSSSPVLSDAHVAAGVSPEIAPAWLRAGGWVEYAPLSIFSVRAGIDPSYYFGTYGAIMSLQSYDEPFDWDTIQSRKAEAHPAAALRLYVSPTFQIRLGPIAAMSSAVFERWYADIPGPLFYEPYRDTLVSVSGGTAAYVSTVVVYECPTAKGKLSAGVLHDYLDVYAAHQNRVQRLGPIVMYEAHGRLMGLPRPTFLAYVGYYVDDPSKAGQLYYLFAVTVPIPRPGPHDLP